MIMMTAQARFSRMCAAMMDDDWRAAVDAEIDLEDTIEAMFAPVVVDDRQLALDLFDYDAEADDLVEARADADFIRYGL